MRGGYKQPSALVTRGGVRAYSKKMSVAVKHADHILTNAEREDRIAGSGTTRRTWGGSHCRNGCRAASLV